MHISHWDMAIHLGLYLTDYCVQTRSVTLSPEKTVSWPQLSVLHVCICTICACSLYWCIATWQNDMGPSPPSYQHDIVQARTIMKIGLLFRFDNFVSMIQILAYTMSVVRQPDILLRYKKMNGAKIKQLKTKEIHTDTRAPLFNRGRFDVHIETRVVWCPYDVRPFAVPVFVFRLKTVSLIGPICYDLYDLRETNISCAHSTFHWGQQTPNDINTSPAHFKSTYMSHSLPLSRWGSVHWSQFMPAIDRGLSYHDDVIKWKHFPRYWPFVRGIHRSPVNSTHKGQWRGDLMFSLICVSTNGWVNNREAGDLRPYRVHYDVTVMKLNSCFNDSVAIPEWWGLVQ